RVLSWAPDISRCTFCAAAFSLSAMRIYPEPSNDGAHRIFALPISPALGIQHTIRCKGSKTPSSPHSTAQ
ncbi:hypothetical protein, partial [Comamonas sp. B-9]|uniref:hypothetical protein n=1 Tax=Comamonas sp. B-9 TaxID=1055192 RepID=UPI00195548DE